MTDTNPAGRKPPTPAEMQERLNRQHGATVPEKPPGGNGTAVATVTKTSTAVAIPDNRSTTAKYLDDIAPSSMVGLLIKFNKHGKFATADGTEISEETDFIAHCDQTLVGWIKFNDDAPPDRHMGQLYDGYIPPPRAELGDTNQSQWSAGLSGAPDDPWKHQMCLVLQQAGTAEFFTFVTQSATGRRSVGNLLKHYERMRKINPNELPVVRLKAGGFQHRDDRVGWVATPSFAVVGRAPRDSVAMPDTSATSDMDDAIPF
jgi:hypothetical protein